MGPLAEASGLTVRTLHHWDGLGLLSPSRRTAGGHREYTEADVVRLYQVLALRGLGLSLETIGLCLDSGVDPARVVRDHLAEVEASLARLGTLRQRLVGLRDALDRSGDALDGPGNADVPGDADGSGRSPSPIGPLLDALRATGGAADHGERVLRRHLDADGVDVLRARAAGLGPAAHYLLEVEWPELYRRAERLRVDGVPPADPRVRRLAARMDELSTLFTGGDREVSAGVRRAWDEDPAALSGDPDAPADGWRDLSAYLDAARRGVRG
ncbi:MULTISPECIES: MerR family transcriptional regulator [Streptomyces]|uniref:MerR family transcriptional regulator n=1 Tax=Streptomyces TaxID=1883 RepID=UPI001CCB99ED|nr:MULTISPECIES: MerR family transcriptional regulator [Streptomyces]UBI38342.1 MerR family transcriptional regulator [Streptomyces mobaraensis]UKW30926.1 MerR family transcriptional regulator [Streptomyces sp. TYQ1024]